MDAYTEQYESLTSAQREAVNWDQGALLVLAGPGSGKTRVLTSRIAKILRESEGKSFRVLALTFTNKAADEMKSRLQQVSDEAEERANVGTFHSFCMQILQQHGTHIGISSDFSIYSHEDDRREILKDGLRRHGGRTGETNDASLVRYLQVIDKLKSLLVDISASAGKFSDAQEGRNVALAYEAYETELARLNALDFNSLILRAYQLIKQFPAIAASYRRTYRYWMIDEFQDTNRAQYKFLKELAGEDFRNIFVVADDDQIIFQWNGASFQQLQKFRAEFNPSLVQLPTNWRCPAAIVTAANNLVSHNTGRTESKLPLQAGKLSTRTPADQTILLGGYQTDLDEVQAVAEFIKTKGIDAWSETAIIARTRALLLSARSALVAQSVPCAISQRRDDFLSPEYQWLLAVLKQRTRPLDVKNFSLIISSYNRLRGSTFSADLLTSQAAASSRLLMDEWVLALERETGSDSHIASSLNSFAADAAFYQTFIERAISWFDKAQSDHLSDLDEDERAWKSLVRLITRVYGRKLPLDQFLQYMALQSKEPPPSANTVTLMTIHSAKGREFDYVHVIGLAEEVLPSFQSIRAGADSQEMEEERRNCFVAITRAREQLVLSWAYRYRGYTKARSRFLTEMGFPPQ